MNRIQNIDNIQKAWKIATQLHEGQKYGGEKENEDIDYIHHIGSVVFEIMNALPHEAELNVDLAVLCAILHDTIEDTAFTYDDVLHHFGKSVAEGVMALTKNDALEGGKREKMLDSLTRIKDQPREVWMVKLADRIVNLSSSPYYWASEKKMAYQEEGRLILENLKEGSDFLAKRLAEKIERYSAFI
jgi:(p)ppGpp synthase/HD superfamily hydrolase